MQLEDRLGFRVMKTTVEYLEWVDGEKRVRAVGPIVNERDRAMWAELNKLEATRENHAREIAELLNDKKRLKDRVLELESRIRTHNRVVAESGSVKAIDVKDAFGTPKEEVTDFRGNVIRETGV